MSLWFFMFNKPKTFKINEKNSQVWKNCCFESKTNKVFLQKIYNWKTKTVFSSWARLKFDRAIGAGLAFSKQMIWGQLLFLPFFTEFCRGRSKPLYEAPNLKYHQMWQSWCQIKENWSKKLSLLSIWSILQWKCQISKSFGK